MIHIDNSHLSGTHDNSDCNLEELMTHGAGPVLPFTVRNVTPSFPNTIIEATSDSCQPIDDQLKFLLDRITKPRPWPYGASQNCPFQDVKIADYVEC